MKDARAPIFGQWCAGGEVNRREHNMSEISTPVWEDGRMPSEYLSLQGVADYLGVSRNSVAKFALPEPDVVIGGGDRQMTRGWAAETIERWNANRPGRGRRPSIQTKCEQCGFVLYHRAGTPQVEIAQSLVAHVQAEHTR